MIKMIGLDLDGTTLNDNGKLSDYTRSVLHKAMDKGIHIVVTTGRTFASLPEEILSISELEYIITSNGAHITRMADREVIYSKYIPSEAIENLAEVVKKQGYSIEIFTGGRAYMEKSEYEFYKNSKESYRDIAYIVRTRNPVENLIGFMLEHKDKIENVNINFEDLDDKKRAKAILEGIGDVTLTSSFIHNWEIGGGSTSKGNALCALAGELGIDPSEELLACGDSPNDISMIRQAKIGICVENGTEETKAAADYIYPSNGEDGAAKAIMDFCIK